MVRLVFVIGIALSLAAIDVAQAGAEDEALSTVTLSFDAAGLTRRDRAFLQALQCAALSTDELFRLQVDPREDDHLWPEGMTERGLSLLADQPQAQALLSPFTAVRIDAEGRFYAVPYGTWELLDYPRKALSKALLRAAQHGDTWRMRRFLRNRARALQHFKPYPYDESDLDWVKLKSRWEVLVGPYEAYHDPLRRKAMYTMVIGRVDEARSDEFRRYLEILPAADKAIAVKAIRVVSVAGEMKRPRGAVVAFHLPNRGQALAEGRSKIVLLLDHGEAIFPALQRRGELFLSPNDRALLSAAADLRNTFLHELAHGMGVVRGRSESPPDFSEREFTSRERIDPKATSLAGTGILFEELKADLLGLQLLTRLEQRGAISPEERSASYHTALLHLLWLMESPNDSVYAEMATLMLSAFLLEKGVVFDAVSKRFSLDPVAFERAVGLLLHEVLETIAADDAVRAQHMKARVQHELLAAVKRAVVDEARRAKLPAISISYGEVSSHQCQAIFP